MDNRSFYTELYIKELEEIAKKYERKEENRKLFTYFLIQRLFALLIIVVSIITALVTEDITASVLLFPLGVLLFIAKQPILEILDFKEIESICAKRRR